MADTFRSVTDIFGIEPPTNRASREVWHETQSGFGVRIMKKRKDGKVRRTYIGRWDVLQPDGSFIEDKPALGLVEDIGTGDLVLTFKDAQKLAAKKLEEAKLVKAGGTVRMTVGDAFAKLTEGLDSPTSVDSPDYRDKMRGVHARFLAHLDARHLDSLKEGFWIDFVNQLRAGKLQVGTTTDSSGKEVPVLREAKSVTYVTGILNTIARLYKIAHEYRGIEGEDRDWDPTRAATAKLEAPNERSTFLKFEDLPKAWAASDQLMSPWWRDMWRVYLLTGLRDSLVMGMRWEHLDLERGLYLIPPLSRGTKRHRKKLSQEERQKPIEMPLSSYVVGILKKRKMFAPKGEAGEWVWYSTETTRRKTKELPKLTDPRSSWQRLTPVIGYWVYKHDLRRTFASLGASVDPSAVLALSLLLLHSSKTISKALGIPQITVEYIKGQQRAMRALTEKVSRAVLELVGELPPTDLSAGLRDYVDLPASIEQALSLEEKAPGRGDGIEEEPETAADEAA